jgi:hypothetical protein
MNPAKARTVSTETSNHIPQKNARKKMLTTSTMFPVDRRTSIKLRRALQANVGVYTVRGALKRAPAMAVPRVATTNAKAKSP